MNRILPYLLPTLGLLALWAMVWAIWLVTP